MARLSLRLGLSVLGLSSSFLSVPAVAEDNKPVPIRVLARVPARPYYVGQAIELRVGVEAGGERPEVVPPAIPDADVAPIDTGFSPLSSTGIGEQTAESNLFVTRFRLIPRRAGVLRIPPVRVRLGDRRGASAPLQVDVRSLPVVGRPAGFLGGVGAIAVEAGASPSTLRVGQDLTYTVGVTGPAARGMTGRPDLSRFSQVPLGLEVTPLGVEAQERPPSRRFRYRIRPTRPGTASLPPLAIAAFDPTSERYVTKVTASVPIRVVDVPRFDPATLDYRPPRGPATSPASRLLASPRLERGLGVLAVAGAAAVLLLAVFAPMARRRRRGDPERLLLRRLRGLDPRKEPSQTARRINDALVEYLERARGRPPGALTPTEAHSAVVERLGSDDLAGRTARLVADCDRARYSRHDVGSADLIAAARRCFEELGAGKKR